jgi:hypothetical protein
MPPINATLVVFILLCGGLAACAAWLTAQVRCGKGGLPITADWIEELSIERYRPMLRLLHGDDLDFLSAQPSFGGSREAQFRAQRVQVFRGYLRCLRTDFNRISIAIRLLMVQSRYDRPDLAHALIRRRVQFAAWIAIVQTRLLFYQWGLGGVDATGLMNSFEALRCELRALLPRPLATSA